MKKKSTVVLILGVVVFAAGVIGIVYAATNAPSLPQAYLIPIFLLVLPLIAAGVYVFYSRDRKRTR